MHKWSRTDILTHFARRESEGVLFSRGWKMKNHDGIRPHHPRIRWFRLVKSDDASAAVCASWKFGRHLPENCGVNWIRRWINRWREFPGSETKYKSSSIRYHLSAAVRVVCLGHMELSSSRVWYGGVGSNRKFDNANDIILSSAWSPSEPRGIEDTLAMM